MPHIVASFLKADECATVLAGVLPFFLHFTSSSALESAVGCRTSPHSRNFRQFSVIPFSNQAIEDVLAVFIVGNDPLVIQGDLHFAFFFAASDVELVNGLHVAPLELSVEIIGYTYHMGQVLAAKSHHLGFAVVYFTVTERAFSIPFFLAPVSRLYGKAHLTLVHDFRVLKFAFDAVPLGAK